jgi:quercetin dioxygenase-like cupin family protein
MKSSHRAATLALVALLGFSGGAAAQDPAVVNAKTVKVKLENDRVRVLEATLKSGDKEQLHSHPASIIYVVSGGTTRNHAPDGTTKETAYVAGETIYRDPLTHWAENIGNTTIHLMVVELKK